MNKQQLFDAIYKELESSNHLGQDKEHYYFITGVVSAALDKIPDPHRELIEDTFLKTGKHAPEECSELADAKIQDMAEDNMPSLKHQLTILRNEFYDTMPSQGEISAWDMITWAKTIFKRFDDAIDSIVDPPSYPADWGHGDYEGYVANLQKRIKELEGQTEPNISFEAALEAEMDKLPYTKHVDDGGYNQGQLAGFEKGAEWARGRAFPAEDGPWKYEVHHNQGPEDSNDWITITDGKVILHFDQHQDEDGEEKMIALLNQLKAKIWYENPDAHIAGYYRENAAMWQKEYDECRKLLYTLVGLKMVKEHEGRTPEYQERQPKAWEAAIEFLNKYQHF